MSLSLKALSEHYDGYYEVAVCNLMGMPRIHDLWSPPRDRKEESEELCKKYIAEMEKASRLIIKNILASNDTAVCMDCRRTLSMDKLRKCTTSIFQEPVQYVCKKKFKRECIEHRFLYDPPSEITKEEALRRFT